MRFHLVLLLLCLQIVSTNCASARPTSAPAKTVAKPAIVTAKEWGSKPQPIPADRKHTPRFITIHHAGVLWKGVRPPVEMVRNMQSWGQKEKNWPDLPYHFMIGPDGTIFEGRALEYEPESNTKYPLQGHVGVELIGNFEEQRMSPQQLESLVRLVAHLCDTLQIAPTEIAGHRDRAVNQTTCPGKDLYRYITDGQIQSWVGEILAERTVRVTPREALAGGPTEIVPLTVAATQPAAAGK